MPVKNTSSTVSSSKDYSITLEDFRLKLCHFLYVYKTYLLHVYIIIIIIIIIIIMIT